MHNTHSHGLHLHRALTATSLLSGIALIVSSVSSLLTAQATGHGSSVVRGSTQAAEHAIRSLHSSAFVVSGTAADLRAQLLLGMLLLLLGFALHALWVVRTEAVIRTPLSMREKIAQHRRRALKK